MPAKQGSCNVDDCEKKIFGRDMCSQHYFRVKRAEQAFIDGPKDRKRRSDSLEEIENNIDYDDFWEFVKKELKIQ
jgi:hypothetical protein